jgi:hypothetical protein
MLCERCGRRDAVGMTTKSMISSDGSHARTAETLCGECFDVDQNADRVASDLQEREVRVRLADGSLFAQLRAELLGAEASADAPALASAAEFVDLLVANLDVPVPDDLRAFADRHRGPAA